LPAAFVVFSSRVACNCGFAPSFDESTFFAVFFALMAGLIALHYFVSDRPRTRLSQLLLAGAFFLGICGAVWLADHVATGPSEAEMMWKNPSEVVF